ncbi:hypothetical protein yfred0001_18610 [Yersinia frederiksenii ATCC 33641]|nr:hypothetical protein yfred0001_18610 [Yersinia frederiksenii ATCC 33641]
MISNKVKNTQFCLRDVYVILLNGVCGMNNNDLSTRTEGE